MMLTAYPAVIHEEAEQCWVEFPDLEGCFSDGDTLPQAAKNAEEALGLFLCSLLERDLPIPAPSDLSSIHPEEGIPTLIVTDPQRYHRNTRAVKKTLTIPEWLNTEAEKRQINFSAVLQQALRQQMQL